MRNSKWAQRAEALHPSLPKEAELQHYFGAITALVHIIESRSVADCGSNEWAIGPACNIVSAAVPLLPIQVVGKQSIWNLPLKTRTEIMLQLMKGEVQVNRHERTLQLRAARGGPSDMGGEGCGKYIGCILLRSGTQA